MALFNATSVFFPGEIERLKRVLDSFSFRCCRSEKCERCTDWEGEGLCRACTVCSLCSGEATEAQAAPRSKSSSKCDDTDSTRVAHCVSRERKSFQELDFRSPPRPQLPSLPLPACAPVDVTACACDKCARLPATSGQVPDVVVIRSVGRVFFPVCRVSFASCDSARDYRPHAHSPFFSRQNFPRDFSALIPRCATPYNCERVDLTPITAPA